MRQPKAVTAAAPVATVIPVLNRLADPGVRALVVYGAELGTASSMALRELTRPAADPAPD
ncbi:hypothetical protein [Nocardia sp. CA-145437]|uniref:hypothetical protein n=1 Tax=Nocardia sp. CA-145437 TaxID=3239980 RepID=UPI003D990D1D